MKEVRFFYVPDAAQVNELPADEAMHAMRVLRLKGGDELFLMDGVGNFYRAQVTIAATHHCYYEILEVLPQERQWKGHFHLAIAPTKMMDRIEWMVEKATEVGVDEISFLNCAFSERRVVKNPRVEKIIVSAVKYIAHCYDEIPRVNLFDELRKTPDETEMTVLIGPEGDFSIDEVRQAVDHGYQSVSLGTSRLRTETAGLAAVMMMQLSKQ